MSRSRSSFRGDEALRDGLGASKHHQHRRANSTPGPGDEFHTGFVKRLVGILDNHGKIIKSNADFLSEISTTLRNHSYSRLPRPVSEPAFNMATFNEPTDKVPTTPFDRSAQPDESAGESSPESMPPTPPDTPFVQVTDWSFEPPEPSEVKYQYGHSDLPKIVVKDENDNSSTLATIDALVTSTAGLAISSTHNTPVAATKPDHTMANNNKAIVPVHSACVASAKAASTSPLKKPSAPIEDFSIIQGAVVPIITTNASASNAHVDQEDPSEDEIAQWYTFHADRAAKSLRYDVREMDLKSDRFTRRMNELFSKCAALNNLMTAEASAALIPNTQQHRRTRSTPAVQGNDHFTRQENGIRDDIKQAMHSFRATCDFYRKQRIAPLILVDTKADVAMPGYWSLDAYGKRRALYHFYNRNKDISKPGDRARYHEAMALLDACSSMSLNLDFVKQIDRWEALIDEMKRAAITSGIESVIP